MADPAQSPILGPSTRFTNGSITMKPNTKKKTARRVDLSHGGLRQGAGRRPRADAEEWGRMHCILKLKTIQALRDGAGAKNFGEFLQWHLDRHPLPTHEVYQCLLHHKPIVTGTGKRRVVGLGPAKTSADSLLYPRLPRREKAPMPAEPVSKLSLSEQLAAALKERRERQSKRDDGNGEVGQG
jgi:hypothetical protein